MSLKEDIRGGINYYNEIKHKKNSLKKYERIHGKHHITCPDSNTSWPIILDRPKAKQITHFRAIATPRTIQEFCRRGELIQYNSRKKKKKELIAYHTD